MHWAFGRGVLVRPPPPILQCLRPLCHLSRLSAHITDMREMGCSVLSWTESCFQEQKQLDPIIPEQANHLISVQCPKRENFRFCWAVWNWSLFLVHPTYWHKRLTPENCTMFLLMWTLNLQDLLQNQNLEIIPVDSVVLYFHMTILFELHVWWIYEINRFRRLWQALVLFVIDRASLFTDHRISGLPIRAKYELFKTLCEQTSDSAPNDASSSCLNWWSSKQGCDTCLPIHSILQHMFWACSSLS